MMSSSFIQQSLLGQRLGLYMHIPFCSSTCNFCSFYQEKPRRADLERYLKGMELEIQHNIPENTQVHTIFWGGGTPGLLPAKDLERLGKALLNKLPKAFEEWTIEMAPSTIKKDKLLVLKDLGITRISMGVQTFNTELLESLGRLHNPNQIYKAYDLLKSLDFDNINLDLIFSIPGQTFSDWEKDLHKAFKLAPQHLATYCLTFEEDTALYVKLSQGKISRDIDKEADFYEKSWQLLESNGYRQYEISNFSKPEYACQHNIDTWHMNSWLGLGPSAAVQFNNKRYSRPHSLEEWLSDPLQETDVQILTLETLVIDSLIFGLRMNSGVDLDNIKQRFDYDNFDKLEHTLESLANEGYLEINQSHYKLTNRGRLVADQIGLSILEISNNS